MTGKFGKGEPNSRRERQKNRVETQKEGGVKEETKGIGLPVSKGENQTRSTKQKKSRSIAKKSPTKIPTKAQKKKKKKKKKNKKKNIEKNQTKKLARRDDDYGEDQCPKRKSKKE